MEEIKQHPPLPIVLFGTGEKYREAELLKKLDRLGDKVVTDKWFNKPRIKSVIRLKDKKRIK